MKTLDHRRPLTLCSRGPYDQRAWFGLLDTSINKVLFILMYCIELDGSYHLFSYLALLAPNLRSIPNFKLFVTIDLNYCFFHSYEIA